MPLNLQAPELWAEYIFILYKAPNGLKYSVIKTENRLSKQELTTGNGVSNATLDECLKGSYFTSALTWYQREKKSCPRYTVFILPLGSLTKDTKTQEQNL